MIINLGFTPTCVSWVPLSDQFKAIGSSICFIAVGVKDINSNENTIINQCLSKINLNSIPSRNKDEGNKGYILIFRVDIQSKFIEESINICSIVKFQSTPLEIKFFNKIQHFDANTTRAYSTILLQDGTLNFVDFQLTNKINKSFQILQHNQELSNPIEDLEKTRISCFDIFSHDNDHNYIIAGDSIGHIYVI